MPQKSDIWEVFCSHGKKERLQPCPALRAWFSIMSKEPFPGREHRRIIGAVSRRVTRAAPP